MLVFIVFDPINLAPPRLVFRCPCWSCCPWFAPPSCCPCSPASCPSPSPALACALGPLASCWLCCRRSASPSSRSCFLVSRGSLSPVLARVPPPEFPLVLPSWCCILGLGFGFCPADSGPGVCLWCRSIPSLCVLRVFLLSPFPLSAVPWAPLASLWLCCRCSASPSSRSCSFVSLPFLSPVLGGVRFPAGIFVPCSLVSGVVPEVPLVLTSC